MDSLKPFRKALRAFFDDFEWIHIILGITGNTIFFAGSILFFFGALETVARGLFTGGSFLMLIGAIGQALVRYVYRRQQRHNTGK